MKNNVLVVGPLKPNKITIATVLNRHVGQFIKYTKKVFNYNISFFVNIHNGVLQKMQIKKPHLDTRLEKPSRKENNNKIGRYMSNRRLVGIGKVHTQRQVVLVHSSIQ